MVLSRRIVKLCHYINVIFVDAHRLPLEHGRHCSRGSLDRKLGRPEPDLKVQNETTIHPGTSRDGASDETAQSD